MNDACCERAFHPFPSVTGLNVSLSPWNSVAETLVNHLLAGQLSILYSAVISVGCFFAVHFPGVLDF